MKSASALAMTITLLAAHPAEAADDSLASTRPTEAVTISLGADGAAIPVAEAGAGQKDAATVAAERDQLLKEKGIWSRHTLIINSNTVGTTAMYSVFSKGRHGPPLDGAELFSYLGHEDYAEHYRTYMSARMGLLIGGGVVFAAGTGLLFFGLAQNDQANAMAGLSGQCTTSASRCPQAPLSPLTEVGIGAAVVGLGSLIAGLIVNPSPVPYEQLLQMVNDYNERVAASVSDKTPMADGERDAPRVAWDVTGFCVRGGGGVSLALTF